MHKLLILLFFLTALKGFSQDSIFTKSGRMVESRIIEINPFFIRYNSLPLNKEKDGFSIEKDNVKKIHFETGIRYDVNDSLILSEQEVTAMRQMYFKGQRDAQLYYTKYKRAGTWTFITTAALGGAVGLFTAIGCVGTPPKEINLDYPDQVLASNREYANGYRISAKRKKSKKVWKNLWRGIEVDIALVIVYFALIRE